MLLDHAQGVGIIVDLGEQAARQSEPLDEALRDHPGRVGGRRAESEGVTEVHEELGVPLDALALADVRHHRDHPADDARAVAMRCVGDVDPARSAMRVRGFRLVLDDVARKRGAHAMLDLLPGLGT
jgi:hypothetical protein